MRVPQLTSLALVVFALALMVGGLAAWPTGTTPVAEAQFLTEDPNRIYMQGREFIEELDWAANPQPPSLNLVRFQEDGDFYGVFNGFLSSISEDGAVTAALYAGYQCAGTHDGNAVGFFGTPAAGRIIQLDHLPNPTAGQITHTSITLPRGFSVRGITATDNGCAIGGGSVFFSITSSTNVGQRIIRYDIDDETTTSVWSTGADNRAGGASCSYYFPARNLRWDDENDKLMFLREDSNGGLSLGGGNLTQNSVLSRMNADGSSLETVTSRSTSSGLRSLSCPNPNTYIPSFAVENGEAYVIQQETAGRSPQELWSTDGGQLIHSLGGLSGYVLVYRAPPELHGFTTALSGQSFIGTVTGLFDRGATIYMRAGPTTVADTPPSSYRHLFLPAFAHQNGVGEYNMTSANLMARTQYAAQISFDSGYRDATIFLSLIHI